MEMLQFLILKGVTIPTEIPRYVTGSGPKGITFILLPDEENKFCAFLACTCESETIRLGKRLSFTYISLECLCGYRSRGPGSIPCANRFSEK
jgi:hypothetical protein